MASTILPPYVARTSASMILTLCNMEILSSVEVNLNNLWCCSVKNCCETPISFIHGATNNVVGSYMSRHENLVRQSPNTEPQKRHANRNMFWWRRQDLRLCDVHTNVCDYPNKKCFPFKRSYYSFFISLFVSFFSVTLFNIEEIL